MVITDDMINELTIPDKYPIPHITLLTLWTVLRQEVDVKTRSFELGSIGKAISHIKRYMRDSSLDSTVRPIR